MIPIRKTTPKRRVIKTIVKNYSEHSEELKKDFKFRCGYCDDIDTWRNVWFEIDHFVPKKYLKTIKDTDYSNLVYACRSCNNSKRAHWPSGDEIIHNKDNEGFIDPCDDNYDKQFCRYEDGRINHLTELGKWMYYKLKLHKPQHQIIFQIEQTYILIEECEDILKSIDNPTIRERLINLYRKYTDYTLKLSES